MEILRELNSSLHLRDAQDQSISKVRNEFFFFIQQKLNGGWNDFCAEPDVLQFSY